MHARARDGISKWAPPDAPLTVRTLAQQFQYDVYVYAADPHDGFFFYFFFSQRDLILSTRRTCAPVAGKLVTRRSTRGGRARTKAIFSSCFFLFHTKDGRERDADGRAEGGTRGGGVGEGEMRNEGREKKFGRKRVMRR